MSKTPDNGFLSRWSSRKLKKAEKPATETDELTADTTQAEVPADSAPAPAAEPAAAEQPAWQNQQLDPASRRQALRDIFKKPGIGLPDGLDEYERDYNYHNFAKLGDVVTHEMRRLLEQQAEQLAAAAEAGTEPEQDPASESSESEDNKLA